RIETLLSEEARRPFNLSRDAMIRCRLFRLEAEEHILLLTIHHIAADEWSLRIILREFSECYGARMEHRDPQLPELSIQYADYAQWQNDSLSKIAESHLEYWKKHLEGHS